MCLSGPKEERKRSDWGLSPLRRSVCRCSLLYRSEKYQLDQQLIRSCFLGNHRGLSVRVSSYSPDVRCTFDSKHEDENVCSKLLGILPISTYTFLFTREKKTEAKSVIVPPGGKKMSNGAHSPLLFNHKIASALALACSIMTCPPLPKQLQEHALRSSTLREEIPMKVLGSRCGLRLWLSMRCVSRKVKPARHMVLVSQYILSMFR